MRIKSASLELILKANGKPTGDEIVAARLKAERDAIRAEVQALPKYLNSSQRRALRKVIAKGEMSNGGAE